MNTPRWFPILALAAILPLLFGCASASGSSSTNSGNAAGLVITTNSLPDATVNQSYSDALQASGGTAPYSWTASSSQIPTGMTLSTAGQLAGTPTQQGSYTFQVQVSDAAGSSSSTNLSLKVTGPAPVISSVTPSTGPTGGGTPVTINGNKLQSGATVTFGGVVGTSVNVASSTQMTAVTPAHALGSVDVTVTNPGGKSATLAGGFGYQNAAPTISSINPTSGPTSGGTAVNITGANFVLGAVVLFGSLQATSVTVTNATQIQAVSPAESGGAVNVVVKNPYGQTATLSGAFSYTATATGAPSISGLSPNTGPDGTQTLINGSNFASGAVVSFGGTQASSVQFVNTNQLSVVVPSISAGAVDVTVNDPGGATTTLSSGFTVTKPQSLLSGCTVDANNNPTCAVPSGWSLATAQGFEGGTVGSNASTWSGDSVESGFAHSGTHALVGTYTGDGTEAGWILNAGAINSREFYASWWEYDESQGRLNDEMFLLRPRLTDASGNYQDIIIDLLGCGGSTGSTWGAGFNGRVECLVPEPQVYGTPNGQSGMTNAYWNPAPGTGPSWGSWTQWEVDLKTNDPGQSNGSITVWKNGSLVMQQTGMNYNGDVDMTNMSLEIGGVYTKLTWWNGSGTFSSPGSCTAYLGDGTNENGPRVTDFSKPCPCANECPANGYVPIFKRYFDDIVVLKR